METPTPYTEYLETQHGTDRPYLIRTFDGDAPNDEFVCIKTDKVERFMCYQVMVGSYRWKTNFHNL